MERVRNRVASRLLGAPPYGRGAEADDMVRTWWVALPVLVACEGGPKVEIPDLPELVEPGGRFLQVTVRDDGGTLGLVDVRAVDGDVGLPQTPTGSSALVLRAGGEVVEVVPFDLPTEVLTEGATDDGRLAGGVTEAITGHAVLTVNVRVPEGADTLEVIDASGVAVAGWAPLPEPALRAQLRPNAVPGFPGVRVLDPGERDLIPEPLRGRVTELIDWDLGLTDAARERIEAELAASAPATRDALGILGFARFENGGRQSNGSTTLASTVGNLVLVNVDRLGSSGWSGTLVHELAHAYGNLLAARTDGSGATWPADVAARAQARFEASRIRGGFVDAWSRLHATGSRVGAAGVYQGDLWTRVNDTSAAELGFPTAYGSASVGEEIAELTMKLQAPTIAGGPTPLCARFATPPSRSERAAGGFPLSLTVPYAKILLLRNLGFVSTEAATACTGRLGIEGPEGIVSWSADGTSPMALTSGVEGGWSGEGAGTKLVVRAEGAKGYAARLEVAAPNRQPPLGLSSLADVWWWNLSSAPSGFYLANDDLVRARVSEEGLVLVSEVNADTQTIRGAIFFLTLQNAAAVNTDTFPLTTFVWRGP